MNFLIIGDIFGRPGRKAVTQILPELKKSLDIDFVIANGENIAHGKGLTEKTFEEILGAGIDFVTTGNHVWKHRDFYRILDDEAAPVIRPANFPEDTPGRGSMVVEAANGNRILMINVMGRVFSKELLSCPFRAVERILESHAEDDLSAIIVDFHAETTSEKAALGHFLDGKVSVLFGTHTHVPTADARVLPGGTAFITDLGMTGVYDSVIGLDKKGVITNFLTQMPQKHEIAEGAVDLYALKVVVDDQSARAESIELIHRRVEYP